MHNIHVCIIVVSSTCEEAEGQKEIEQEGNIKTDQTGSAYEVVFTGLKVQFCEELLRIR